MGPREAAYFALLQSQRGKQFIALFLEDWKERARPSKADFALAYEIASGATRRALTLDYIAKKLSDTGKINLRMKEKALLRIGLFQAIFMDRIPMYAAVDETVSIAKRHCHQSYVSFLNAILRKVYEGVPILPMGDSPEALSIYYSYPSEYISDLIWELGIEKTRSVLAFGNKKPIVMARHRPGFEIVFLDKLSAMKRASMSSQFYIQNATPAHLMLKLSEKLATNPTRFLDMCAAPGGKLLAAHDLFPKATVYANDLSDKRLSILRKNVEKYHVPAVLSTMDGLRFKADQLFDLVIVDVPCSNSGVLNKRPEARWRLKKEYLEPLKEQQLSLLKRAISLAKPGGEIWYITCSILKQENEDIVEKAVKDGEVEVRYKELVLPNTDGWDGGFGCALIKK